MNQGGNDDRLKMQFPRIRAREGTPMAYVIHYLRVHPVEPKFVLQEFLYYSFFVRALNLFKCVNGEADQQDYIVQEGWKSIWHHWGTIESICAACNIPPQDVVKRLQGEHGAYAAQQDPFSRLRIGDLAAYAKKKQPGSNAESPPADTSPSDAAELGQNDRKRMNDISRLFTT
jgi:hypothetical protein